MTQQITPDELKAQLDDQLSFLELSAEAFDNGAEGEAKRLATTIRVLFHDTGSSHSLLGQLSMLGGKFVSTARRVVPGNKLPHGRLVAIRLELGNKTHYFAPLDECVEQKMLDFKDWWEEVVFIDRDGGKLTRKKLVLTAANQDGGAHVDPALDETYANLKKNNSLSWTAIENGAERPMDGPERAAIRQVTHEVLKVLRPGYSKKPQHDENNAGMTVFDAAIVDVEGYGPAGNTQPNNKGFVYAGVRPSAEDNPKKMGRNERCWCGSGKKFKHCHGKLR